MSTSTVKPIPAGMHSLTPYLVCADASAAIAFYQKAFGATELTRLAGPDGKIMHAQIRIGDSAVMLTEESPQHNMMGPKALKNTPVSLYFYVDDADKAFERAVSAGATVVTPLADMFWGDRWAHLEDPFGHRWHIASHIRDVGPEELRQAAQHVECGG